MLTVARSSIVTTSPVLNQPSLGEPIAAVVAVVVRGRHPWPAHLELSHRQRRPRRRGRSRSSRGFPRTAPAGPVSRDADTSSRPRRRPDRAARARPCRAASSRSCPRREPLGAPCRRSNASMSACGMAAPPTTIERRAERSYFPGFASRCCSTLIQIVGTPAVSVTRSPLEQLDEAGGIEVRPRQDERGAHSSPRRTAVPRRWRETSARPAAGRPARRCRNSSAAKSPACAARARDASRARPSGFPVVPVV